MAKWKVTGIHIRIFVIGVMPPWGLLIKLMNKGYRTSV